MADGALPHRTQVAGFPIENRIPLSNYSVVSYFSGCGGLDLGFLGGFSYLGRQFKRMPFDVIAAYDVDPLAVEAYRLNIGEHAHLIDLANACPDEIPAADVLLGGFPCQEFSQCGPRKGLNSERGRLYQSMVRYAKFHRPKIIVGENVAGLKYRDGGAALTTICSDFASLGYRGHTWEVWADNHGVPQARHRLILLFVRDDLIGSVPTDLPVSTDRLTAKAAISDLLRPGRSVFPNQDQYFKAAKAGNGHGQGDEKTPRDGPAYTIRANSKSRVQFHYSRPRRLTVRECARIQTFPDTFLFPFPATTNMRLIGNAVPPVLGHVVAQQVAKILSEN